MAGLDPRRADLAVAGAVLLDTILRRLGADEISLCEMALREGLILDYVRRNERHIAAVERYPDIRRRSVEELGERCHYWSEHARQVARLATSLFDQTAGRHGLGPREREWLKFGALLHDVGVHISYRSHHKHSHYLIRHGDLRGFDPEEVEIIALIARYHRQGTPKKSHEGYADLKGSERRIVRLLSAFVRVAEGLDRSHAQVVAGVKVVGRRRRPRGPGRRQRRRRARTVGGGALPAAARDRARMPGPRRRPEPPRHAGFAKARGRARLFGDVVGPPSCRPSRRWRALEARPTTRARR